MRPPVPLLLALLAACAPPAAPPPTGAGTPGAPLPGSGGPEPLRHDFGTIPHGAARQHEFAVDLQRLGHPAPLVPLRVQLDCACGRAQLLLRDAHGAERPVDGRPDPDNAPRPGELLVVRIVVDTALREAVDLPAADSRGHLLLQPTTDRDGSQRLSWPILLRFAVDAPVELRPAAALDFGRVPQCARPALRLRLEGDAAHRGMAFGPVTSTDPRLQATLEPDGAAALLRVQLEPGELGNGRAALAVATSLPDYRVGIPVTWKTVPDLEALPLPKLSFRADLSRAQTEAESQGQFLLVTDHDAARPPEFAVRSLVGDDGRDAAAGFAVTFAPVPGQARQQRLFVRYRGGFPQGFRGRLLLAKPGSSGGPELPIDLVAFPTQKP